LDADTFAAEVPNPDLTFLFMYKRYLANVINLSKIASDISNNVEGLLYKVIYVINMTSFNLILIVSLDYIPTISLKLSFFYTVQKVRVKLTK